MQNLLPHRVCEARKLLHGGGEGGPRTFVPNFLRKAPPPKNSEGVRGARSASRGRSVQVRTRRREMHRHKQTSAAESPEGEKANCVRQATPHDPPARAKAPLSDEGHEAADRETGRETREANAAVRAGSRAIKITRDEERSQTAALITGSAIANELAIKEAAPKGHQTIVTAQEMARKGQIGPLGTSKDQVSAAAQVEVEFAVGRSID